MSFSIPAVATNYMLLTFRQFCKTDKCMVTDFFIIMNTTKTYIISVTYTTDT